MADNVEILMSIIGVELRKAQAIHKSMRSSHEGYAVIKEELDELWLEVKVNPPNNHAIAREAIQTAAMAARLCLDVLLPPPGRNPETEWVEFLREHQPVTRLDEGGELK